MNKIYFSETFKTVKLTLIHTSGLECLNFIFLIAYILPSRLCLAYNKNMVELKQGACMQHPSPKNIFCHLTSFAKTMIMQAGWLKIKNCYYFPLKSCWAFQLNKLEFHSSKITVCQVYLKFTQWFSRWFLNFVNIFHYFAIIFPWERACPFISIHLNPH